MDVQKDKGAILNLHMVSDSSGETLVSVARASMLQFNGITVKEYVWSLVQSTLQVDKMVGYISSHTSPSFVIYNIFNDDLRDYLKQNCQRLRVPCIPILSRLIREISSYLGIKPNASERNYKVLSEDYYSRVDAMNYVLSHDDGQGMWDIEEADIVLIGVSRTSKSPTSIYLAYHGYKVSNIPFVVDINLPWDTIMNKLVIGFTIDPDRLIEIRKNRLIGMGDASNQYYVSKGSVLEEIQQAKQLFNQYNCPVIDVTQISVEEIAAKVMQYYYRYSNR